MPRFMTFAVLWLLTGTTPLAAAGEAPWEPYPDGSAGRVEEFRGSGGVVIGGYIRKPAGPGPFPVVINLHGGGPNVENTYSSGRAKGGLVAEYLAAGWAVYAIDFRVEGRAAPLDPIEYDDTMAGIESARRLPFVDPQRVALTGGSHGAHVMNRVASRLRVRCAVLYSPTYLDAGQMKRALAEEKDPAILERLKLIEGFVDQLAPAARDTFKRASALAEAPRVRCPILVINGGTDISLPQWMVREYVAALRDAGKEVETYLPLTGDHGFYGGPSPEGQEARKRTMAFFRKHLAPAAAE